MPLLTRVLRACLVGVTMLAAMGPGRAEDRLRIGGMGGALGTMYHIAPSFEAVSGTRLEVVPSLGSSGGIRAVQDGMLDVAIAGRPLTEKEKAAGLREVLVTRTPFIFVTSTNRPTGLARADVARVLGDPKAVWSDGQPVRVVLRPPTESDYRVLFPAFPGTESVVATLRQRGEVPVASTDQQNLDLAEQLPGSFVTSTLAQLKTETRALWAIPIDGVVADIDTLRNGQYPYAKSFHYITGTRGGEPVARFIAYLRSPDGQAALIYAGNLP